MSPKILIGIFIRNLGSFGALQFAKNKIQIG
jgi:hypothetical protein